MLRYIKHISYRQITNGVSVDWEKVMRRVLTKLTDWELNRWVCLAGSWSSDPASNMSLLILRHEDGSPKDAELFKLSNEFYRLLSEVLVLCRHGNYHAANRYFSKAYTVLGDIKKRGEFLQNNYDDVEVCVQAVKFLKISVQNGEGES